MTRIMAIAAAGALGAVARYGIAGLVHRYAGLRFPVGTLAVNVLGCFLLGLLASLSLERWSVGPTTRAALLVGLLGAFTTFSAFSYETLVLMREGTIWRAALNVGLSVLLCLAAAWGGVAAAARV
ncbi:fluoride efflux transporter CrcB [bacterium]|nr:fluoride efflux transporter CrcB [bacterium]